MIFFNMWSPISKRFFLRKGSSTEIKIKKIRSEILVRLKSIKWMRTLIAKTESPRTLPNYIVTMNDLEFPSTGFGFTLLLLCFSLFSSIRIDFWSSAECLCFKSWSIFEVILWKFLSYNSDIFFILSNQVEDFWIDFWTSAED